MKGLPGITKKFEVTRSGNAKAREPGKALNDPLAGTGRQQTSTHYDRTTSSVSRDMGGKLIEGQEFRGYVRNEDRRRFSTKDATVAPDGTKRVKEL